MMMKYKKFSLTSLMCTLLLLGRVVNTYAQTPCSTVPVAVKIEAKRLDRALMEFSKILDCKVTYQPQLVKKFTGKPLDLKALPFDALARLIQGTGLEAHAASDGLRVNQADQQQVIQDATALQKQLQHAVRSQKLKAGTADGISAELGEAKKSVVKLARSQGFVSAAEKASYQRILMKAQHVLSAVKS